VPDSRFKRGINEDNPGRILAEGFQKSVSENARAVSQCRLEAGRIIQVSSYYFRAQLLERFLPLPIRNVA